MEAAPSKLPRRKAQQLLRYLRKRLKIRTSGSTEVGVGPKLFEEFCKPESQGDDLMQRRLEELSFWRNSMLLRIGSIPNIRVLEIGGCNGFQ
jgi:hypothetical protein